MRSEISADDLRATVRGFQQARILLTAIELDLFTVMGQEGGSAVQVAERAKTDPRATSLLLNSLVAMGYLRKEGDRYYNSEVAREYLVKGSADYMGGALKHSSYLWMTWSHLTEVVRSGKPADVEGPADATESFITAMHVYGGETAPAVASLLDFSGVKKMLDLGGGPGTFAIEFARRNPRLTAVVFDRVDVVPIARRIIAEAGLTDRVGTMAGNFLEDDIGSGYDLAFVSSIIHSYGPEENQLILRKTYQALNSGGQVVVRDFIMDESKTEPAFGAVFAINMLVNTDRGATYSEGEVREWLEECGFQNVARKGTDFDSSLMVARRP